MRGCATELGYACADSTQHLSAQPVCSVELVWMKSDNRKMNGGSFWPPAAPRGCLSGYGYGDVVQRKGTNARDSNPHLEVDLGVKQQLRRGEEGREDAGSTTGQRRQPFGAVRGPRWWKRNKLRGGEQAVSPSAFSPRLNYRFRAD